MQLDQSSRCKFNIFNFELDEILKWWKNFIFFIGYCDCSLNITWHCIMCYFL